MRLQPTTYRSKLYKAFKNINPTEYGEVMRFYERNEDNFETLEFEEYVELLLAYTQALFELGLYRKHVRMADVIIELSIVENLRSFNGEELYENTLFKKAASYFHLKQYEKAEYILKELIKINPNDKMNLLFLERCFKAEQPKFQQTAKAISLVLLLLASIFICLEMIIIRPLFPNYALPIEIGRIILFSLGAIVLAFGFLGHQLIAKFKVFRFRRSILKK